MRNVLTVGGWMLTGMLFLMLAQTQSRLDRAERTAKRLALEHDRALQECARPDGAVLVPFFTYDDAAERASQDLAELDRRVKPWGARK